MLSAVTYKYDSGAEYQPGLQQQNLQHSLGVKGEELAGGLLPRVTSFPEAAVLLPPSNK